MSMLVPGDREHFSESTEITKHEVNFFKSFRQYVCMYVCMYEKVATVTVSIEETVSLGQEESRPL